MEGSQTFKDMKSIDRSKRLNIRNIKNRNNLQSPTNAIKSVDRNKSRNVNFGQSHNIMSVESESHNSYAFSQAKSFSPTRVIEPLKKQDQRLQINDSHTKTIFQGGVLLSKDPFKTGNKHFYNMLRPALYQMFDDQDKKVKNVQIQKNLQSDEKNSPYKQFYQKRQSKILTSQDIQLLDQRIKSQDKFKNYFKANQRNRKSVQVFQEPNINII